MTKSQIPNKLAENISEQQTSNDSSPKPSEGLSIIFGEV